MSSIQSADSIRMDYMQLLVAQMENQNPLEPMSNEEMAAQLTQFSQLEQLESMNQSFSQVYESTQLSYASSLVGKEVSFVDREQIGQDGIQGVTVYGIVEEVNVQGEETMLSVGSYDNAGQRLAEHSIPLNNINTIGFKITDML